MKLLSRNLVVGMRGNDVRELQRELVWLGVDILSQEITNGHFGETTRAAVQTLQKQSRLEPDGVVDTKTVEAITKKLRGLKRVVRGNLLQPDGQPLARAKVRAFDKELRRETKLGEATCDAAGYYEIRYLFSASDRVAPSLVVKGFATARAGKPVAVSAVMFDANPDVVINLVAGEAEYRGLSEFERLMKDITPLVERQRIKVADLSEDEKNRDVSFASRQTRHPVDRVAHAVLSHRHAERSRLAPEVFYAWSRQGLPTEPSALLSQDPQLLRRALVQAVNDNVIPRGFETEAKLNATMESLKGWRAGVALESPPDPKQMTLGTLVKSVLSEKPLQQRFMRAYAEHSGPVKDFWQRLRRDEQLRSRAGELELAVLLGNLGQHHPPLVDAVRSTPGLKKLKDLASLNDDGWHALITEKRVGTPSGVEGTDDADKARQYARSLANAVEAAVPTDFFVARLKETDVAGKEDLLTFFRENPSFDIKDTRVDAFLKENPDALNRLADKSAAVKQLKGLERLYRLAPGFKPAMALQQAGKDSAHGISRLGQSSFVASYGRHFPDAAQAKAAHRRARQVSASAIALIADVNPAMGPVATYAVPDSLATVVAEIPQWSVLFDSLDSCSCDQCQSVYSPAAYLVDLLAFLKDRNARLPDPASLIEPPAAAPNVKDVLFHRRPDLGEIELTCENTNTVMPYVDLVLEVLEDAVSPPSGFSSFELDSSRIPDLDQGRLTADLRGDFAGELSDHARIRVKRPGEWWVVDDLSFSYGIRKQASGKPSVATRGRQTSGTQQERAANPPYVNPQAYATLKDAVFPWSLPFDQSLEEARAYLGHLGVPRHQIMEAFLPGERSTVLGNPVLAAEHLGLSSKDVELIFESNLAALWVHWGFEAGIQPDDALATIRVVDDFLQRSRLEYRELLELVQMTYVSPGHSLTIVSTDAEHPDTCDTGKLELHELNADVAGRIVRFLRLWRKLDWSMSDLDRAIAVLGGDLSAGFLVRLSHLSRLQQRFNLPVVSLLAFWAPLDTVRYINHGDDGKPVVPSLYDRLFRSRASISPLDPAWTEDPEALTGTLSVHADAVAAALEVSAADLFAIVTSGRVFPQGVAIALDLANLSQAYRHAALAKALTLRVQDYLRALDLVDEAPFTSTTRTLLFVEKVTAVRDSGLGFAELDYLLRHRSDTASGIALEERVIVDRLRGLGQELQKGAAKEAIARKLAEALDLEMSILSLLEPQWASLMDPRVAEASKYLLASLMDPTLAPDPGKDLTRANFPVQFDDLVRLHKISVFVGRFNVTVEMLEWLLSHGDAQGLPDLRTLPTAPATAQLETWMRLVNLFALRHAFLRGATGLLELLAFAHSSPAPAQGVLLSKLAEQTNWNSTDLTFLVGATGFALTFPNDLKNEKTLLRLREAFAVLKRLGISAEHARNLAAADVTPGVARSVRQAVRAKYGDARWSTIAKPLRDVLREKQRSALVDYLTARGPEEDGNGLYGHFLIDVEMDPCMMTSRIKQAIGSVQLFVQRCLMNLEAEVQASSDTDDAWNWWKWMKNYRVWEANRKVFLYPENWIEPELRDDKSPFFKELESELLESDLTLDTAEQAFLAYVDKLDQVARLEVMGVYHQKDSETAILHAFARTQAPPRVYYHRQRMNAAYWTAWTKVDLDIEGEHLIPVLWNSRLFLFWPMFMEKAEPSDVTIPPLASGGSLKDQTRKYWDMKLAWSELKQGQWSSKKISSRSAKISLPTGQLANLSNIFFAPMIQGSDLAIHQLYDTTGAGQPSGISAKMIDNAVPENIATELDPQLPPHPPGEEDPDPPGDHVAHSQNRFFFGGCYFDPLITSFGAGSVGSGQDTLIGTRRSYMAFEGQMEAPLNLPVRTDIGNSQAALAQTPGQHRVISQGADRRVTRNPFFFQDPSRNFLIVPTVSRWVDDVFDPSLVGSSFVSERRVSASSAITPDLGHALSAAITASSSIAAGLMGDTELAARPDVVLGPDSHHSAPFVLRPNTKYSFHAFYHPYVCPLISILNRQGLDQMLRREVQLEPHRFLPHDAASTPFSFQAVYGPSTQLVAQPYPTEEMDFSFTGAYSLYNWELFFHAPLLIADRLTRNQRFEEAAKWFHYIFNPTDTSLEPAPQRFWQTKEFFRKTTEDYQRDRLGSLFHLLARADELRQNANLTTEEQQDLRRLDDLEASIKAWRQQPFKPHLVARTRTTAYQKAVVMKYLDNLMAWGDQLFRRDTLETINEATHLYVLAADILGKRPVDVLPRFTPQVHTFNSIEARLDDFANALVEVEGFVPVDPDPTASDPDEQPPTTLYFCLPRNDKLLRYWDTVADRLFKIRHCMNIEGTVRQLPLFEPPIDPALLVRGVAAGLDLNSLLNDIAAALPVYRFAVLSQKATELCGELRSLGANLLAVLEKRDTEALALLRAKHETGLLEMIEQVREKQIDEAAEQLQALSASRDVTIGRLGHYQRLLGENNPPIPAVGEKVQERDRPRLSEIQSLAGVKMFPLEVVENTLLGVAQGFETHASTQEFLGAVLHAIPDANLMYMGVGFTISGLGDIARAAAAGARGLASAAHFGASTTARLGSYIARELDWVLQHNQAAREIMQIDKQILAAEIRREIARHELRNHRRQMENAFEVERFMRDRYTNHELYSWMVGQVSGAYFQAYQLAYETSKRTEQCYRHEIGVEEASFIQFGYWDSLKKGLMAGDKLHHDLKRMEVAYLDENRRGYELTRHVSLLQVDPLALIHLRTTGKCHVSLPEALFDMDGPGHYMRRIKTVALSIPCVTGPYANVNCTLTLQNSSVRNTPLLNAAGYARDEAAEDARFDDYFGSLQSIVTSSAQSDSGLFETNLRDERYLPFENSGAISAWQLELPANPSEGDPQQFDYNTISDVILHIRYTALEGGVLLRNGAVANLKVRIDQAQVAGSVRLFSVRHEFPTEWAQFQGQSPGANHRAELTLNLREEHYPFWSQGRLKSVLRVDLLASSTRDPVPDSLDVFDNADQSDATVQKDTLVKDTALGGLVVGRLTTIGLPSSPVGEVKFFFEDREIGDLWIAVTWGE